MINRQEALPFRSATKRIVPILLAAVLTVSTAHATCGDPTGDGEINASDALNILFYAVHLEETDLHRSDVNMSVGVTVTDALMVLAYSVGRPVTLRCPVVVSVRVTSRGRLSAMAAHFYLPYVLSDEWRGPLCSNHAGDLITFDADETGLLKYGMASLQPFNTPHSLFGCYMAPEWSQQPFAVDYMDAVVWEADAPEPLAVGVTVEAEEE